MTFLNDTLEHRQTVTSLRTATGNQQASTSTSASLYIDDLDEMQLCIDSNTNFECASLESLNITKVYILSKIKEWKSSQQLSWHKEIRRKELIKAILVYRYLKRKRKNILQRIWVRPIFSSEKRYQQGDGNNLIMEMTNPTKFFEYFRMTAETFTELFKLMEPSITKQDVVRISIPAAIRLQICLRYLASGDMHSISFAFRVGLNTVSNIVSETCQAIWNNLKDKVFPENIENVWIQKANEFEEVWDFPNCIGAIDGKHIVLQAPPHSGSTYYNYKNAHSIVLMALADANYCFTMVDIGAEGRRSDGGIFHESELRHQLENNYLKLPKARSISEKGPTLPYVIVGDEAFALTRYMLRPYPRSHYLDIKKQIFNYRLSRARRVIECAFGILTSRWRILRRPIATSVNHAILIVQATVCLHNFLMMKDLSLPIEHRTYFERTPVQDTNCSEALHNFESVENNTFRGTTARDLFAKYFYTSGAIKQQWTKVYTKDF